MSWSEQAVKSRGEKMKPLVDQAQLLDNQALAELYKKLDLQKEALESDVKSINLHHAAIEAVFTDRFAEADTLKMEFENGLTVKAEAITGLKIGDQRLFVQWLKSAGLEHELRPLAGSVGKIVREAKEAELFEGELPPGIIESDPFIKFSCK